ncbi:MAG: PadR family transcriptional regulator [Candidatus Hodarchaeales archaeon]|jgi:DNA-binding PadR family transcriptional regulator
MFQSNIEKRNYHKFVGKEISRLLILSLLDQETEHSGYSLIKRVKQLTMGQLSYRAGTIYPQFEKLSEEGLIEKHIRDSQLQSKDIIRQKAVYSITHKGIDVLTQLQEDWKEFRLLIDRIGLGMNKNEE